MGRNKMNRDFRLTRSKAANFDILADCDEEFPTLGNSLACPGSTKSAGPAAILTPTPAKVTGKNATSLMENQLPKQTEISGKKVNQAVGVISSSHETEHQTVKELGARPRSNLFKDNRNPAHGIKLRYIPPKGNELDFSDNVLPYMVDMWGHCLVGCFTDRFPGLKAIHELRSKWNVNCLIRTHDKVWVTFKFQNELDRTKVLNEGPYTVFGKQLILKVLSDDFSFEDEEFLKVYLFGLNFLNYLGNYGMMRP
ncbi:unnamed protein product [Cuscuta europaea]|uniref:DUF4283 domain-containing protein n=1 Tax=Cuscuta europaea TaxID=41803 RepID=A0A9P0Z226_CUSEU|nr:unnamed protein product [Cuscuta europaea]